MNTAQQMSDRELRIRKRLKEDFLYYAPRNLKILEKPSGGIDAGVKSRLVPFELNRAQQYIHQKLEEQLEKTGNIRAILLKGRQQGASTYVSGRFYHKTTQYEGVKTFILTHAAQATDNLFAMVQRYHDNSNKLIKPHVGKSNAKEMTFPRLDGGYQVATAGAKGAGRSSTLICVHGSEVAFWDNGEEHLKGMLQAVPDAPGTEVILESTANGLNNIFHEIWQAAEAGSSPFMPIFVPWYWQPEYSKNPDGWQPTDDADAVPEGELTDYEYAQTYGLDDGQMFWRRMKIMEMGRGEEGYWAFKQEYPATAEEAFTSSSAHSLIPRRSVIKARKSNLKSDAPLIIGIDPAGEGPGDEFAFVRRRARYMYGIETYPNMTTKQALTKLAAIAKLEKPARMYIDVGGMGKPLYDMAVSSPILANILIPVNFGEQANDPEEFVNRKAEMAWGLKDWLEEPGGVSIPDEDRVQAEFLASVPDDPDNLQRKRLKSKKWMRSQGIRSPNVFDAACLTFAEPYYAQPAPMSPVEEMFMPDDYNDGTTFDLDFDVFD